MNIRTVIAIVALGALAGCGADSMSAAATGASIKKQELQEGQKTLQRAQERVGQAIELQNQSAHRSE